MDTNQVGCLPKFSSGRKVIKIDFTHQRCISWVKFVFHSTKTQLVQHNKNRRGSSPRIGFHSEYVDGSGEQPRPTGTSSVWCKQLRRLTKATRFLGTAECLGSSSDRALKFYGLYKKFPTMLLVFNVLLSAMK